MKVNESQVNLISPYTDIRAYGLRILSASLKQEGYNVKLIFLPKRFTERYDNKTLNEVIKLSKNTNLTGISLMTNYFSNAVQITNELKRYSNIPVLWGGIHPTIRPEECINFVDMVCIGEGEETLVELMKKIENGKEYKHIPGMWFKTKNTKIMNQVRPLIQDLNSIPFPDYEYEMHYIAIDGRIHQMDIQILKKYLGRTYITMSTRGCPFNCSYCCNNFFHTMYPNQNPMRKRSISNIINELKYIKSHLPFIENIKFDDDAFFAYSVREIEVFCKEYKREIDLPLIITGATASTINRDKLSLLVDAGLVDIKMGIQTGSERTRKLYMRKDTNQQIEKAAKVINEFQDKIILPGYDIILDNPWENDEDLIETIMLLVNLPTPYHLSLFSLTFYPGTALYRKAKKDGIIKDDLIDIYNKHFHNCKKTYLNRIFFLINEYTKNGISISPNIILLLTNQKMRQLKLNWFLYFLLKLRVIPFEIKRIKYLLKEGLKDIKEGDWSRIQQHINIFSRPDSIFYSFIYSVVRRFLRL